MSSAPGWTVVVPVKRLERAKSRLHVADAQGQEVPRPDWALAFAADVVAAAAAARRIGTVVVVTDDPLAADTARALGAQVVADEPDAGLNPALVHAIDHARRDADGPALVLSADLPCIRGADIDLAVSQAQAAFAAGASEAFVADTAGTGSTLYAVAAGHEPSPAFGPRSRAAHRAAGAVELPRDDGAAPAWIRLRRDVDTAADLWDAVRLGVGERTAGVVARAGSPALP